jgi:hypothetical protein
MTKTLNSTQEVVNFLTICYGFDARFLECAERTFFNYTAGGAYVHESNLNYNLAGQMGVGQYTFDEAANTVTCTKKSSRRDSKTGKLITYTFTSTLALGPNGFTLRTHSEELRDLYLAMMPKLKGKASYNTAVAMTGIQNPTDLEVANEMAKAFFTVVNDVPNVLPEEAKAIIDYKDGLVEGKFFIKGVETTPKKINWWITPLSPISGQAASDLGSTGDTVEAKLSFRIDNDFNNRDQNTIIIPNSKFRITAMFTYQASPTATSYVQANLEVTTQQIPVDYFGL